MPPMSSVGLPWAVDSRRVRHGADGDVDQEDRPPAEPGDIGLNERAADQLRGDRGEAERRAEIADGARAFALREGDPDNREHLRVHQRRRQPLQDARCDQHRRAGRQPAQRGGDGEADHPDDEQLLAPIQVAEPPPRDQQDGEGQAVARHHQFQILRAGPKFGVHGRQGNVDDEEIERRQERTG
jgi:hypothetical protein